MNFDILLLVYNEARHLNRFFEKLYGLDLNIFIVDSYSTDGSVENIVDSRVLVLKNKFLTQGSQLSWALKNVPFQNDWVLRLDCDEYISENALTKISEIIKDKRNIDGVAFKRRFIYRGKLLKYGGSGENFCLRLVRYRHAKVTSSIMDEKFVVDGKVVSSEAIIIDDSKLNRTEWIAKHNNYASREALKILVTNKMRHSCNGYRKEGFDRFIYYKFPPYLRCFLIFFYRLFLKGGFLDGKKGVEFLLFQCLVYRLMVDWKISSTLEKIEVEGFNGVDPLIEDLGLELDLSKFLNG